MTDDVIVQLGQDALKTLAMVAAPMLLSTLIIGLIISIFQALTQINENTLTFVPKMIVIGIVLILAGPWMLDTLSSYTIHLFENISTVVREQ
ncbi:MAG: flagellar biosynthesis protein FliQ [Pseudobdellovibrio sp.]